MAIGPVETVENAGGAPRAPGFSPAAAPEPGPRRPGCELWGQAPKLIEVLKLSLRLSGRARGADRPLSPLSITAPTGLHRPLGMWVNDPLTVDFIPPIHGDRLHRPTARGLSPFARSFAKTAPQESSPGIFPTHQVRPARDHARAKARHLFSRPPGIGFHRRDAERHGARGLRPFRQCPADRAHLRARAFAAPARPGAGRY